MMRIPPLFHWSPTDRRQQIERFGLRPGMRPTVTSIGFRAPYVCLAEHPQWAWQLSGALHPEISSWDLWQVSLGDGHRVRRLPNFEGRCDDRRYYEWRVYDRIFKRGVWWVGSRTTTP